MKYFLHAAFCFKWFASRKVMSCFSKQQKSISKNFRHNYVTDYYSILGDPLLALRANTSLAWGSLTHFVYGSSQFTLQISQLRPLAPEIYD